MTISMHNSVILLQNERVYDDQMLLDGKPLLTSSFVLAVHDCVVPLDILEKRLAIALAKRDRTFYYANWAQSTVIYREAI
jgi:hypothetical protein